MVAPPTNFSNYYIVLKNLDNNNIDFYKRVVYCQNHNIVNNTLNVINMDNGKSLVINISDIEYYLTFNDISEYRIGETVYFSSGFDGENEIVEDGIIISIEYEYKSIYYTIKTSANIVLKISVNYLKFVEHKSSNKYKLGSFVSIHDDSQPNEFIDGKIISFDNINNTFTIQFADSIRKYNYNELNYPCGYNLIKIH